MDISSVMNSTAGLESLVQQYMYFERQPLTRLQSTKSSLNIRSAIFDDLSSKISSLKDLAEDLADTEDDSIYNAMQVTSNDSDVIQATASTGAAEGTYVLRVRQMATATSMKSTATLNNAPSIVSSSQVVAGTNELDTSESFADAGFDTTPTGSIFIDTGSGEVEFDLSNYTTIDALMDAINDSTNVDANIYYDETRDKFFIEKVGSGGYLRLRQSSTDGFLTQAKIATDTAQHEYITNVSGLQTDVFLYETNFDNAVSESDSGSFKINGVTIEWDADQDTFNDIISRINNSTAGVTAFYDDTLDKVMITSTALGSDEIEFEDVSGTFLGSTLKFSGVTQQVGQDAKFTINSTSSDDEITKSSNIFTINGITYTLKAVTVANDNYADSGTESVTITSSRDISALQNKINSFLANLNSLNGYIKTKSAVDPDTYTRGALAGDTVFSGLRNQLFSIMMGRVSGLDSDNPIFLSQIGITFDSNLNASITNSSALEDWVEEDPSAVADLFNSTNGVATRIENYLESFVESDGIIEAQQENIQDQIERIDDRIERLEDTLSKKEEYYRNRLASMQMILNELIQQQTLVTNIMSMYSQ